MALLFYTYINLTEKSSSNCKTSTSTNRLKSIVHDQTVKRRYLRLPKESGQIVSRLNVCLLRLARMPTELIPRIILIQVVKDVPITRSTEEVVNGVAARS